MPIVENCKVNDCQRRLLVAEIGRLRAACKAAKAVLIRERMDGLLSEPDDRELMDVLNDALAE
jgi:hypothetical protein